MRKDCYEINTAFKYSKVLKCKMMINNRINNKKSVIYNS